MKSTQAEKSIRRLLRDSRKYLDGKGNSGDIVGDVLSLREIMDWPKSGCGLNEMEALYSILADASECLHSAWSDRKLCNKCQFRFKCWSSTNRQELMEVVEKAMKMRTKTFSV
ncbi:MAG: hypothetical protein HQ553_12950 [Chloroflexi bacterium]|nr:hypothetical protein [Chloroflexota bacterium]